MRRVASICLIAFTLMTGCTALRTERLPAMPADTPDHVAPPTGTIGTLPGCPDAVREYQLAGVIRLTMTPAAPRVGSTVTLLAQGMPADTYVVRLVVPNSDNVNQVGMVHVGADGVFNAQVRIDIPGSCLVLIARSSDNSRPTLYTSPIFRVNES